MKYKTFDEFWPFYVSQHNHRLNRFLHVFGSVVGLSTALFLLIQGHWALALFASAVVGYGCAWMGHFIFEKNIPATFQYPVYSFIGDLRMIYCVLMRKPLR